MVVLKLLVIGGTMFMSATNEEMQRTQDAGIDHVTYALAVCTPMLSFQFPSGRS